MSVLFSGVDKNLPPFDEDTYRAWLISRNQPTIVHHSGRMQLKRLCALARRIGSRVTAAVTVTHEAIIAAKLRRVRRELGLHARNFRDIPQQPLILGDKWDF